MTQHEMRRIAMQAIYLANQGNLTNAEEVCQKALKALELKSFPDYSTEIVNGVLANKKALDEQLSKYLKKGWRLNRINEIDLAILEVALYEMQNSKVIEPVAALKEALNLCDEFSSKESKKFVNGLLANFIKKD